jgi:large subunit ribosomal protein L3
MMSAIIGIKKNQTQSFDEAGNRIPVTSIVSGPCHIVAVKKSDVDGYEAVQLGIGTRRATVLSKALQGHIKKAGLVEMPRFIKEVRLETGDSLSLTVGSLINESEILKAGDKVEVTGISKGKGFQGGVKRHGFKGGSRTHGQSDRERAPGSIGMTTTPGRVFKGKRMAGRMGNDTVTVKNLTVVSVDSDNHMLKVKGLIPGAKNAVVIVRKIV